VLHFACSLFRTKELYKVQILEKTHKSLNNNDLFFLHLDDFYDSIVLYKEPRQRRGAENRPAAAPTAHYTQKNHTGDNPMGTIKVTDHQGKEHTLAAAEGWRLMEIIRDHGLEIEAVCGGACACATCHVIVDSRWAEKLHPARDDERDMLEDLDSATENSRLSCQVIWNRALDGLGLRLADSR